MSFEPHANRSQGRIELPKAARGHATSYSTHIDGIVLSVAKNNVPVKHVKCVHGMVTDVRRNVFMGDGSKEDECYQFRYRNAIHGKKDNL